MVAIDAKGNIAAGASSNGASHKVTDCKHDLIMKKSKLYTPILCAAKRLLVGDALCSGFTHGLCTSARCLGELVTHALLEVQHMLTMMWVVAEALVMETSICAFSRAIRYGYCLDMFP